MGYGPAPGPTKKGLVPHFHVRWGVDQILQIWSHQNNTALKQHEEKQIFNQYVLDDQLTKGKKLACYTWIYRWTTPAEFTSEIGENEIGTAKKDTNIQGRRKKKKLNEPTFFFLEEELYCELNYHDQKIRGTFAHDIRKHWTAVSSLV